MKSTSAPNEATASSPGLAAPPRLPARRNNVIDALVNSVRTLSRMQRRGDLADLRRLDVDNPAAPAFWRIITSVEGDWSADNGAMVRSQRYARLLRLMAHCPDGVALSGLGKALAEADVSEARVQKLLAARGPALDDAIDVVARRLAKHGRLPIAEIAVLLTSDPQSESAERARMEIARGYWGAKSREEADLHSTEEENS
jgi:hypothetical protein